MTCSRSEMQWRIAIWPFASNQLRISFEQCFNFLQVTIFGRILNFTAEGKPVPNKHKNCNDGAIAKLGKGMFAHIPDFALVQAYYQAKGKALFMALAAISSAPGWRGSSGRGLAAG